MKIKICEDLITWEDQDGVERTCGIGSKLGFQLLSKLWLRSGWDTKYVYGFSWMGRPVIQLPEDLIRIQEVIFATKPDVVVETGIAHGGSLIFYASLLAAMGKGSVVGIDVEIRRHNRVAIETHLLSHMIEMIEGSSIDPNVIAKLDSKLAEDKRGIVILDSCHTKAHVLAELRAYAKYVALDSYIVACDGIMKEVAGAPRTEADWKTNNPQAAIEEFLSERDDFILEEPTFPFNEGEICERVTYWPNAFLRRIR